MRVSNSLKPDQARPNVGPDLVPNCLQRPGLVPNYLQMSSAGKELMYHSMREARQY